jgi:hypothetical protein
MTNSPQEILSITGWLTWRNVGLALGIYTLIAVGYGYTVWCGFKGPSGAGAFGDMYGAFSAFFAGLSLIGIVFAILLQRQQLAIQAEELQHQREEIKRMASAQERSEEAAGKQIKLYLQFVKVIAYSALIQARGSYTEGDLIGQYAPLLREEIKKIADQEGQS